MADSDVKATCSEVRTVLDLEGGCGSTPCSPPATAEDRAHFQQMMLQMHTISLQSKAAKNTLKEGESKPKSTEDGANQINGVVTQDSLKKKRSRRSGKKSNKTSPADSPMKTVKSDDVASMGNASSTSKEGKSSEIGNGPSAPATPVRKTASEGLIKGAGASRGTQGFKVEKKVVQSSNMQSEVTKVLSHNGPDMQSKQKNPLLQENQNHQLKHKNLAVKSNVKELKNSRDQNSSFKDTRSGKSSFETSQQVNGAAGTLKPLEDNPFLFLRSVLNLIKPVNRDAYHCIPCDKDFSNADRHVEKYKENHTFYWKCQMRQSTLFYLPKLSQQHVKLLDDLVVSVVKENKVPDEQQKEALLAWHCLDNVAKTKFKDCSVRWFGSQVNKIALSDNRVLNMDLLVQNKEPALTFHRFIAAVEEEESFENVERVVATNFAHANITHKASGFVIQLSLNNNGAFATSKLIQDYMTIDCRVLPLCIFFRYWGRMCGVDQGENGSWQGHAFPIMVIHFLQQKHVLPVLHDMVEKPDGNPEIYLDPKNIRDLWRSGNDECLGKLMFDMFLYYSVEHDVEKHVVSITQLKPFFRKDTKWSAKRIAVIDPFQPKHNISRYISANMYDYIHFCLLSTTCALGIPRTNAGPLYGYICPLPDPFIFQQFPALLEEYHKVVGMIFEVVLRLDNSYNIEPGKDDEEVIIQLKQQLNDSKVYKELLNSLKIVPDLPQHNKKSSPRKNAYQSWWVVPNQAEMMTRNFSFDSLELPFTKDLCTDKEVLPIACTSCHKNGHLRGDCPDEVIPKMSPLPSPSKELDELLSQLCLQILESRSAEASEMTDRLHIREDLLNFLRQFDRDIELHLFGSSLNGFGGRSSDIDMCLTFNSNPSGEGLNFPHLVEELQRKLKGHRNIYRLLAITTAKVPIVKFEYDRIQVDLSLYNMLGIMNTKLLHAYSTIDPRVRPIVYMMKYLAKTTGIGDASRGSLSSYAYSLMSLYFLQQVEPPVIPVLQELYYPNQEPKVEIVDGANVYFFKDIDKLDEVWPYRNKNKSSLGELWLQLLEFYASEKFHNSQRVVCIRKQKPLLKFDKLWTSTNICIEDPFDLNHNLGSGLSKRMNIFIVKTLQKAYSHFSTLPNPDKVASLEKYFFNENTLSVGKPPSDRGCHFCRCIGHVQNDCPKRPRARGNARPDSRPDGRTNMAPNRGNAGRPNFNYDNRGGIRRDAARGNNLRVNRDSGRISNMPVPGPIQLPMPMPLPMPIPMGIAHPLVQNQPKPNQVPSQVIVPSMKPPGFPVMPPGHPLLGPPARIIPTQGIHRGPGPVMQPPRPPMHPYMYQ